MNTYRKILLFLGDTGMLVVSFFLTILIRGQFSLSSSLTDDLLIPFICVSLIALISLFALDLYDFRFIRPVASNLWRIAVVVIASPILGIILFYTFNFFVLSPKTTLGIFFGLFCILFILWRRLFYRIFSTSFKSKTVVWGTSAIAHHLFSEIAHHPPSGRVQNS